MAASGGAPRGGVLSIKPYRRLWIALGLSSLGDWLGLLALTALAGSLAPNSYAGQSFAIATVLFLRVAPALVLGPLAGYIADRLDRRWTLITGDILRGLVFLSIAVVGTLEWVFVATVIIEAITLVWLPAKDATIPNLVPRHKLEAANQVSIATTYGSALPAAGIFVVLSLSSRALDSAFQWLDNASVTLPLAFNAASFVVSGLVIATLHEIPRGSSLAAGARTGVLAVIKDGWSYVIGTRMLRGLVVGVTGAFAAGGVVIGLARVYVTDLGGGDPGYGLLFAAVFAGLGLGMWRGPRYLSAVSRRRLFGFSLTAAGALLAVIALVANLVLVVVVTVGLGFFAGAAWVTGYTLIGYEVEDAMRGRTFAFLQTLVRLSLSLVLALAPLAAGLIGEHRIEIGDDAVLDYNGASITMFGSAVVMVAVGLVSYHHMNDRPGISLLSELRQSLKHDTKAYADRGLFVAFEGGEGAGKSTQARRLRDWLSGDGYDVVLTHEPGDTAAGRTIRHLLLSPETGDLDHRAEALLYAADKAEHLHKLVRPALSRGAVVITDRYVDSTLAYQGAGRQLEPSAVSDVARWATADLRPHLTVLLDVDPAQGLRRFDGHDRLEAQPLQFHERVRESFLALAAADPDHYLVLDAHLDKQAIENAVRERVTALLPLARRHHEVQA